jgi:hypothetical protein
MAPEGAALVCYSTIILKIEAPRLATLFKIPERTFLALGRNT